MSKKRIYVAGRMRNVEGFNFLAFDQAADALTKLGWDVCSPADMDRCEGMDAMKWTTEETGNWTHLPAGCPSLDEIMQRDFAELEKCDAIYMLSGWTCSEGAGKEYDFALEHRITVCIEEAFEMYPRPTDLFPNVLTNQGKVRTFATGATRDSDQGKIDFDGFLSPQVLERFAVYMHKHRVQSDGTMRASDNWQKGIDRDCYRKSAWRHFFAWWKAHRNGEDTTEHAMALLFNIQGDTHEALKASKDNQ